MALDHTYFVQAETGLGIDAVWVHNDCEFQGHHGIPKFMGGNPEQELYGVESGFHVGAEGFHSALNYALAAAPETEFPSVGGIGGARQDWLGFFDQRPGTQRDASNILLDTARSYDFENGTNFVNAAWRNIIGGNFRVFG